VVELPAYVLSVLDKTPFALQAKAPVVFDPGQAARIKLSKEAELIVLERSRPEFDAGPVPKGQESWMLVSPVAGEAKSYRVQALLAALTQLKAKRFDGPADPDELMRTGLERPVLTVVVEDDSGKQIARLQIGKAEKEDTFVLGDAREKICLVPTAALASVNVGQADLRAGPAGGGGHEKP